MATSTTLNGQSIQLGHTQPGGLAIGSYSADRQLISWNIPNRGLVEMYINPQSFIVLERKLTKKTRTKGGYIIQYWGEELPEIDISGTTGSGGIEGINVLRDIYRQEQVGFNDVMSSLNSGFLSNMFQTILGATQSLSTNPLAAPITSTINTLSNPSSFFNSVVSTVGNVANVLDAIGTSVSTDSQLLPTLAALATAIELWYSGKIYRGYFSEFRVDEKSDPLGIFNYSMKFIVTRQSGRRHNSFPWQRSVTNGPANSDVIPLSFGALATGGVNTTSSTNPATPSPPPPSTSRRGLLTG
jgi:hypothetical protein